MLDVKDIGGIFFMHGVWDIPRKFRFGSFNDLSLLYLKYFWYGATWIWGCPLTHNVAWWRNGEGIELSVK